MTIQGLLPYLSTKNETMAPLHVATSTCSTLPLQYKERVARLILRRKKKLTSIHLQFLQPALPLSHVTMEGVLLADMIAVMGSGNVVMALTKILVELYVNNDKERASYLNIRLYLAQGLYPTSVPRMNPWLQFMWPHYPLKESYLGYIQHLGSLFYICTKNETMAPLHVTTLILCYIHKVEPQFHSWQALADYAFFAPIVLC